MSARRRLGRLFASFACASVATGLPWPLLLVLVFDRYGDGSHGAVVVGLAGAARMAPYVVLSWAAGSLGDRFDRGRLLLVTLVLRAGFLSLAAGAVALGHVGWAVALAALAVTAGVPAYPCVGAALPALAGPDRDRATDVLVTIEVSAWVIGPALGGLMVAVGARAWTLWVAAALAGVASLLVRGLALPARDQDGDGEDGEPGEVGGVIGTLRHVARSPAAMGALGLAALLNVVETTTGIVLLPLSRDVWHEGDHGFGLAVGCLGAGALGAPLLARWVRDRGLVLLGALVVAVALTPVAGLAAPLLVLAGAAGVVVEGSVTRALQDAVPDHLRAGTLGVADTVMVTACLVGTLTGPLLAGLVGARAALVLAAAACLLPVVAAGVTRVGARPVPACPPYDAERDRTRPDPRGAPAVGGSRVG